MKSNNHYLNLFLIIVSVVILFLLLSIVIDNTVRKSSIVQEHSAIVSNDLSFSDIKNITCDSKNRLWIGTASGLYRKEGEDYIRYFHYPNSENENLISNNINNVFVDNSEHLWIGTDKGLLLYEEGKGFKSLKYHTKINIEQTIQLSTGEIITTDGFDLYKIVNDSLSFLASIKTSDKRGNTVKKIIADDKGGIWWISVIGLGYLDKNMKLETQKQITEDARICNISEGKDFVWISQDKDLFCLNKKTGNIKKKEFPVKDNIESLASFDSLCIVKTYRNGYMKCNESSDSLEHIEFSKIGNNIDKYQLCAMTFTPNGSLILALKDLGFKLISKRQLELMSMNNNILSEICYGNSIGSAVINNGIIYTSIENKIIQYDSNKNLIYKFGQDEIFPNTPYFRHDIVKLLSLPSGDIVVMSNSRLVIANFHNGKIDVKQNFYLEQRFCDCAIKGDTIYVITRNGDLYYSTSSCNKMKILSSGLYKGLHSAKLLPLPGGNIFVSGEASKGMVINKNGEVLEIYNSKAYPYDVVSSLTLDSIGNIWVGTQYNEIYKVDYKNFKYTKILSNKSYNPITNICIIDKNRLIYTDRNNLFVYALDKKKFYRVNIKSITDKNKRIKGNTLLLIDHENIFLGTSDGCLFLPIVQDYKASSLNIGRISITKNNGIFYLNPDDFVNNNIVLSGNNLDMIIHILGFNNDNSILSNVGEYKLVGYDREWKPLQESRIKYFNVPSGNYQFRLRLINSDKDLQTLNLKLLPLPCLSWQALCIYFLLLVTVVLVFSKLRLEHYKDVLEIKAKENENELERKSNEMNKRFFANINHEFRNPLTMIVGPIMQMQNDPTLPYNVRQNIEIVGRSAQKMFRLVDQALDFSKLDNDTLKLQVEKIDLSNFLKHLIEVFRKAAEYRQINIALKGVDEPIIIWIDCDKLDKIMDNLMSNAMKNTPEKGYINVDVNIDSDMIMISIRNSGSHIPEEQLPNIFKRYYQVHGNNCGNLIDKGTGIGLNYVNSLVKLHHGFINVKNVDDCVEFCFRLPFSDVYSEEEKIDDDQNHYKTINFPKYYSDTTINLSPSALEMLIVDDDIEMSFYIRSIFCDKFKVKNLYSAEEVIKYLENHEPDIILSDIMMGDMSGLDLCKWLKSNNNYSHIPVILISGKNKVKEQIEGLKVGAIAYIIKPFNPDILKSLVDSQINNIQEVRKLLVNTTSAKSLNDKLSPQDQDFIDNLYKIMEKDIMGTSINIDEICRLVGMSRTKLFYKMKTLTGTTPATFFRIFKLNKAAEFLREGKYTVSEVSTMVGFDNISYFSTLFKKHFGVSPSDYR